MKCPHCDRDIVHIEGQRFCQYCGGNLESADKDSSQEERVERTAEEATVDTREDFFRRNSEYCPWEDQENLGFFKSIGLTLKQSLMRPEEFFSRIPTAGGLLNPLLYALIVKTTGSLVSFVWLFVMDHPFLAKLDMSGTSTLIAGILVPLGMLLTVFGEAGLVHLSLFLTGGASRDFESTFRVICYSSGPELLDVIPIIGGWVAIIWKTFLIVIGLREVHRITTGRAVLALILPSLVCCAFIGAGIFMFSKVLGS